MKNFLFITFLITISYSCESDDSNNTLDELTTSSLIIGRWKVAGFENSVMKQITPTSIHTLYSIDGNFGGLETAIPNPKNYDIEENDISIDYNFGNIGTFQLNFKCDGDVVEFLASDGTLIDTYFREDYVISNCEG